MSEGTELATRPELPSPTYAPEDRSADDIILPRLKVGESNTQHVKKKRLSDGDIFTEVGKEDLEPVVLVEGKGDGPTDPILFFVLAPVRKSWSWNDRDTNEFQVRPFKHPDVAKQQAEYGTKGKDKAIPRLGYNYLIALPDHPDPSVPFKFLLKGMSSNAARDLETELSKASADGPFWEVPFELVAEPDSKDDYTFNVFHVRRADVPDGKLAKIIADVVEPLVNASHDLQKRDDAIEEGARQLTAGEVTDAQPID